MVIGKQLKYIAQSLDIQFTVKGNPVSLDDVFSPTVYLPALIRRSDQLSSFCFSTGLGVTFDEMPGTRLGVTVNFNDNVAHALRVLCAVEIMYELMESAPNKKAIPLDDLMYT